MSWFADVAHLLDVKRWCLILLLPACFQSSSGRDDASASVDASSDVSSDAPSDVSSDVAVLMDAPMFDAVDADVFGLLTPEQAECLGLTEASCATCHLLGDDWVLRPPGASPPDVIPPPPEDCGPLP